MLIHSNVNTNSEESNEANPGFERVNITYVKGLVYKERNFTANYDPVAKFIKDNLTDLSYTNSRGNSSASTLRICKPMNHIFR